MYENFYNLRAEPFRLSPDHHFCYEHKGFARARAYLTYAFTRAEGFVVITGRPGTGKTTLIGDLIESLAKDDVATANLVSTQLEADDLLRTVAYSFGVGSGRLEKAELLQRLKVLFHKWHRDGRRALLIVDEAQDLSITAMEELRLLTNIQVDGQPLLQIFLLGQPELRDLVFSPEMDQVHQRIVAASHLEALEQEETEAYVTHRLDAVGWRDDPAISKTVFPLIYKFSEGIPRRINLICSRLFLHGCVEQKHRIGVQDIRTVIKELQSENLAAGNKFSEEDFALEDEFEQAPGVTGPVEQTMAQVQSPRVAEPVEQIEAEVQLHAVSNESIRPAVSEPDRTPTISPRQNIPIVKETPQAAPVDIPVDRSAPVSHSSPAGDQDAAEVPAEQVSSSPDGQLAAAPLLPQLQPGRAASGLRPSAGTPAKRQAQDKGAGTAVIVAIIIVLLLGFLAFVASRPGVWGDWQTNVDAWWMDLTAMQPAPVSSQAQLARTSQVYKLRYV
jgi:putative secretion ATPase (PEP-CTERM system associated)